MSITLGFDVYGTLIDTAGISAALVQHVGERATTFASLWRSKQLEYAFRRALMNKYRDFAVCTRQALDYLCLHFQTPIAEADRGNVMAPETSAAYIRWRRPATARAHRRTTPARRATSSSSLSLSLASSFTTRAHSR